MNAVIATKETLLIKIFHEISLAKRYQGRNAPILDEYIRPDWEIPQELRDAAYRSSEKIRIGYIVATCSPTTRAHIELAEQASRDLGLTHVFFILWPFHYIAGFHSNSLNDWVEKEQHIDEKHREAILKLSLQDAGSAASVYSETAALYRASSDNFSAKERDSFFWTGTWFVLRVLQRQVIASLGIKPDDVSFYFICGEDQFNPNVHSAVDDQASEKVWRDYSIAHHLAIHSIYTVPRGGLHDTLEYFDTHDSRFEHQVVIGQRLAQSDICATKIRRGLADPLEAFCFPRASDYIRRNRFWGYGSELASSALVSPSESYEPLRKFIPRSEVHESTAWKINSERILWADHTTTEPSDPYVIIFRTHEKPHFQKYYVS